MRRLLIIEDSQLQRILYQRAVETRDPDFIVHVAGTLAEGLTEAMRFEPEVVLLDMHLPDSDGEPTLRYIEHFKPAKVIAMSGDAALQAQAMEAGADDFMGKLAGDSAPLLDRINALLPPCSISSPLSS